MLKNVGREMSIDTNLRLRNIASRDIPDDGSEIWILNQNESQKLEVPQMRFLCQLLRFTRFNYQKQI
jgi:hypothetical protein